MKTRQPENQALGETTEPPKKSIYYSFDVRFHLIKSNQFLKGVVSLEDTAFC